MAHRLEPHTASRAVDPWTTAWLILAPLALCLVIDKTIKIMAASAWLGLTLEGSGPIALLRWFWAFNLLRFVAMFAIAWGMQRWLLPRRHWLVLPLGMALMFLMALAIASFKPESGPFILLAHWSARAAEQGWMLLACLWRDAILICVLAGMLGLLLALSGARQRAGLIRTLQVLVVLACAMVGFGLMYELTIGQPMSLRVLAFGLANWKDAAPMVAAETHAGRVAMLVGALMIPAAWAWRHRKLAHTPMVTTWRRRGGATAALAGTAALLAPAPAVGFLEAERHSEATLVALYRTALPSPAEKMRIQALKNFEATGQGRWHTTHATLQATSTARPPNVVIVMMESMRAASTTIHDPQLPTTPYLKRLADQGLMVADMNAVIPRTAAAWMAILTGQYPLTNEGTGLWAREQARHPERMRPLPALLREQGYATGFFTPTHLKLLDDETLIGALAFDKVASVAQIAPAQAPRVNYFGVADEWMVEPVLAWSRAQRDAGRPFMATLMTNVGHHAYETPPTWRKLEFEGVTDPTLKNYYNCLRYVDHVIETLMRGYEAMGVLQDTVFVFIGDHGQMFGEHGLRQTFNAIYQHGVHVPAVIYAPGRVSQPRVIEGARQQIDLLPTLVQMLGYRLQGAQLPGQSLLEPVPADRPLFFSSSIDDTFLAQRRGTRKYIYSFERQPLEIYDLATDPQEARPLRDVPEAEVTRARRDMLLWKAEAEVSMYGNPQENYRHKRFWVKE